MNQVCKKSYCPCLIHWWRRNGTDNLRNQHRRTIDDAAVLATCDIRSPYRIFKNGFSCLPLLANEPERDALLRQQLIILKRSACTRTDRILLVLLARVPGSHADLQ